MRLCAEKFTDRAPVWTEKFKKIKNKEKNGSVESRTYLCYDGNGRQKMAENRNTARKRSAGPAERSFCQISEKILVGIGSEWKKKEGAEEEEILHAAEQLKKFLDGKDYYMITSLADEDAKRLPFDAGHIAVPHSVSFTEENWKSYTLWLSCTLNRNTVLLELGENYKDPSLIRWPFEKTAMLNNKAYLFRVHKIFSQVPEELAGKSCPVAESSVKFAEEFFD